MWHRPALRKVVVIAAVFATGLAIGVLIGARVGVWELTLADAQYKASLLASDVKAIRAGNNERDDHPIRSAVSYRLANPYEGPDLERPENWKPGIDMQHPFVRDVIEGQKVQREYVRKVLQRYGEMPHNSTVEREARKSAARPSP